MNDLCVDVGFNSLIKKNEVLCGDNVNTITCEDGTFIAVLADGLGSGVKACILSTLTSKIISTMVSEISIFRNVSKPSPQRSLSARCAGLPIQPSRY